MKPNVEVIIPAYNCSKTLKRTLSSLATQTDPNFYVTVVDDCSTEDIKSIVDIFYEDLHIRYIRNENNIGCGMSRQVGIDNAMAEFITFLDSDDMFMPYTIEVFNTVISSNPNTEYLHTHFYEQTMVDGTPILYHHKENYTACHGKLYNVKKIKEFGIKNSPTVRWADDSYFNSMCSELLRLSVLAIPTVLWTNNPNSIMRSKNEERNRMMKSDFLDAMLLSAKFVLQKKGKVDHLKNTLERIVKDESLTETEREKLDNLIKLIEGGE